MNTSLWVLIASALVPAIALCIYVYIKDRVEKEPLGLLLKLFVFGAIATIPILICELIVGAVIDVSFEGYTTVINDELYFTDNNIFRLYTAITHIVGVAAIEEGFKLLVLWLFTRKNKNFNFLFDGLIYAVFVSLGFAALENVLYVLQYGLSVAFMRAILSVPGHMFFGVIMGYNYTMWFMHKRAHGLEQYFLNNGILSRSECCINYKSFMISAYILPVLTHGFYNYCCSVGSTLSIIALIALVIFLYIFCFIRISKMSKADTEDSKYAFAILLSRHPKIAGFLSRVSEETK